MASVIYNNGKKYLSNGSIDWDTDAMYCMLVTSSYTADIDAHDFQNDITNEVANGNGYTTGGVALASLTDTIDTTADEARLDAADASWTTATFTARGAVIYKKRGGAATADEILCYIDFGADKSCSNGTFTIQWNSEGIINLN